MRHPVATPFTNMLIKEILRGFPDISKAYSASEMSESIYPVMQGYTLKDGEDKNLSSLELH